MIKQKNHKKHTYAINFSTLSFEKLLKILLEFKNIY